MIQLKVGEIAPEFELNGIKSEKFLGKKLVLFFYPKDNTSGCTAEACNLRDNYDLLKSKGFEILGVSPDSEASHKKFTDKFQLPFQLIPDTEKVILHAFGVWGEKKMYGKTYMGVNRTTFVISEDGFIEKIITKVQTSNHAEQIIKVLEF